MSTASNPNPTPPTPAADALAAARAAVADPGALAAARAAVGDVPCVSEAAREQLYEVIARETAGAAPAVARAAADHMLKSGRLDHFLADSAKAQPAAAAPPPTVGRQLIEAFKNPHPYAGREHAPGSGQSGWSAPVATVGLLGNAGRKA